MRQWLAVAMLLSVLPLVASGQSGDSAVARFQFPEYQKCRMCGVYKHEYKKFTDSTLASVEVFIGSNSPFSRGSRVGLITASFAHEGEKIATPPAAIRMTFNVGDLGRTDEAAQKLEADTVRSLALLLDDSTRVRLETRRIGKALQAGGQTYGPVSPAERARKDTSYAHYQQLYAVDVPIATYMQIIAAKKVEGRLGPSSIEMPGREFLALRNLASWMHPAK